MTDRDRLIELVEKASEEWVAYFSDSLLKGETRRKTYKEGVVDYLLANGVICPPCKVGDVVYYPYEYGNKVLEKTVIKIVIEKEDRWLDVGVSFLPFENIGKTVFLTKEEAEVELRKRSKDNA